MVTAMIEKILNLPRALIKSLPISFCDGINKN